MTAPTIPAPEARDVEAPYGRKADGTPKRRPGRRPGTRLGGGAPPLVTPRAPTAKKAPSASKSRADFRDALNGLFQMPAAALAMVAAKKNDERLLADSLALGIHGPNVANALNDLAQENPRVAAVLEKITAVGPYGALITAVVPLGLQILANHGAPTVGIMGTEKPSDLIDKVAGIAPKAA